MAGRDPGDIDPRASVAFYETARASPGEVSADSSTRRLGLGDKLGRFDIVKQLGAGGMGVVYVALDPLLNRQVALKLLRAEALGPIGAEAARARLLREAQAMARLSHPNVITVHEVGAVDDQVFIVMELNDGKNLTDWLATRPTCPEIVRVFIEAGRGLVAAHRAGLIHRDFKPDNVLIARDGRVRVTDFGLVDSLTKPAARTDPSAPRLSQGGMLGVSLTHTGAVLGTPPYMAPEQHQAGVVDERTDQYSFCVSLFEALHGARPFTGAKYRDLVINILEGNISPAPAGTQVPVAVQELITRGLRVARDERFASMDELLEQLGRAIEPAVPSAITGQDAPAPRPRRWLWLAAASVLLAAGIAAMVLLSASGAEALLEGSRAGPPPQDVAALAVDAGAIARIADSGVTDAPPASAATRGAPTPRGPRTVKGDRDDVKATNAPSTDPSTGEAPTDPRETAAERRRRELNLDFKNTKTEQD